MTSRDQRLEAPHRRLEPSSRFLERVVIFGYRAGAALLARISPGISRAVIGRAAQASYLLWPMKQRWSNTNFGHVLGLRPDHPEVRRLALRAYKEYGRYVVELMRLPSRPLSEIQAGVDAPGALRLIEAWRAHGGPLIISPGHVGNNEAAAAGLAKLEVPVHVVADDSMFPELFELLSAQRISWGVGVVPWRNLRAMYSILRRNEILALVVDWGYRADGVPVKMFGAWTTLPAGPATLAARTGALLAHIAVRRNPDGSFRVEAEAPFTVPDNAPASIQRATQELASALERTIRVAPEQWYSFKPCWPRDPEEAVALEARAAAMLADTRATGGTGRADLATDASAR